MSYIQQNEAGLNVLFHILSRNCLLKDNTKLSKAKHNLLDIRNQFVPPCKHFPPRL